ncbi:MAG: hypothetical protein ACU833_14785 [Gammaproteobacteria bacterium]
MKKIILASILLLSLGAHAENDGSENSGNVWKDTTLSDSTIKKIQMAKYQYIECIGKETEKKRRVEMDTRVATDAIMKACESQLTTIREVFIAEKVPAAAADDYLKRSRIDTARNVLKEMMFAAAARKMGQ